MSFRHLAGIALIPALVTGCNFFHDTPESGGSSAGTTTVEGAAVAGKISGGKAFLKHADRFGRATGAAIASADTDGNGHFKLVAHETVTGPVVVEIQGGDFSSEADSSAQTNGTLTALVSSPGTNVFVTPLSNIQAARASNLLDNGAPDIEHALTQAQTDLVTAVGDLGLGSTPLTSVAPDFSSAASNGFGIGVALGVIEQLRKNLGVTPADLNTALANDLSDGKPDGKDGETQLMLGGGNMSPTVATTSLAGAANDYANSTTTVHHDAALDVTTQTGNISGAAISEASVSGQLTGSSGGVAPMIVGNHIYVYFAAREDGLVQLDMTDPAHPVANRLTTLNADIQTQFPSYQVDGVIPVPVPINGKQVLLVFSYHSQSLITVDAATSTIIKTETLTGITNTFGVSGAGGIYIAGGIADGKRNLVWLATADGSLPVNPVDLSTQTIIPQPVGTVMDENIGGDPASDIVFSPNYYNHGIVVFNLAEKKAYVQTPADWATMHTSNSVVDNWGDLDQAALDTSYKVALISNENNLQLGLVNYTTPTGATTDTGTFTPLNYRLLPHPASGVYTAEVRVAVDSASHLVFGMNSWGSSPILVGKLDDPSKGVNWQGFSQIRYTNAGDLNGPGDPHAIGAFNIAGRSYGFALVGQSVAGGTSRNWDLMAVDLDAFVNGAAGTDNILTNDPTVDTNIMRFIGY